MTDSLRTFLKDAPRKPVSNPGLEMERYLPSIQTGGENKDKSDLLARLAGASPTEPYKLAYKRWKTELEASGAVTHLFRAVGSLTVGMASESVLETSLTLHPVYGMPYLPGDALKGLARHYFESTAWPDDNQTKAEYLDVLFGNQGNAAHLRYYDAWYFPKDGERPLRREVLTVHHPNYYNRGEREHGPWDFDDPNPVPYLSAQGDYLVAVSCPTDTTNKWTDYALRLLAAALGDWGIGGKTSSGDGRLTRKDAAPTPVSPGQTQQPQAQSLQQRLSPILQEIESLRQAQDIIRGESILKRIDRTQEPDLAREAAKALKKKVERLGMWKNSNGLKSWYKKIEEMLQ